MDRQDAKPNRPSLLAGAENRSAPGAAPARILSDMEGRSPRPARASRTGGRRWPMALVLVGLALAAGWLVFGGGTPVDAEFGDADALPLTALPALTTDAVASAATTAMIVDEPAIAVPVPALLAAADAGEHAAVDNPFALVGAGPSSERAADRSGQRPAAPRQIARAAPPRARAAAAAPMAQPAPHGNSDLLTTLLRNIEASKAAGRDHDALDALVRHVGAGNNTAPVAAPAATQARGAPSAQQTQIKLRQCPPANTAEGLKCRQQVCAPVAGQDPACPAG